MLKPHIYGLLAHAAGGNRRQSPQTKGQQIRRKARLSGPLAPPPYCKMHRKSHENPSVLKPFLKLINTKSICNRFKEKENPFHVCCHPLSTVSNRICISAMPVRPCSTGSMPAHVRRMLIHTLKSLLYAVGAGLPHRCRACRRPWHR